MLGQPKQLQANVRYQPGVAIIDLRGEINGFTEETLNGAYSEAQKQNPETILLNFSGVDYINSTGIALIVGLLAQARKARRHLVTYGLSDHYQEIFRITRLSDFMTMHPDELTALKAIQE